MNYSLNRITDIDADHEPITLLAAQSHLNLTIESPPDVAENARVSGLITTSRMAIEKQIGRPIGEQTFELGLRWWPCWRVELPRNPVTDLLSIKYTLATGETKTLFDKTASPVIPSDVFMVDTSGDPAELWLKLGKQWPIEVLEYGFPIRIRFKAGITDVPEPLIQAMLLLIGHFNENREAVVMESRLVPTELPLAVQWLCKPYAYEEFR